MANSMQCVGKMYLNEVEEQFELFHCFVLVAGAENSLRERRNAQEQLEHGEWMESEMESENEYTIFAANYPVFSFYRTKIVTRRNGPLFKRYHTGEGSSEKTSNSIYLKVHFSRYSTKT